MGWERRAWDGKDEPGMGWEKREQQHKCATVIPPQQWREESTLVLPTNTPAYLLGGRGRGRVRVGGRMRWCCRCAGKGTMIHFTAKLRWYKVTAGKLEGYTLCKKKKKKRKKVKKKE
jgi:hypothetical protein